MKDKNLLLGFKRMVTGSIHTNTMAMVALQGLNSVTRELNVVMKQVNTGYKVNDAFDDGATFNVAQSIRADIKVNESLQSQIAASMGSLLVANTSATNISNVLTDLKGVISTLANDSLGTSQRAQYQDRYNSLRDQIVSSINQSSFNDKNLLNGSGGFSVMTGISGTTTNINGFDFNTSVVNYLNTTPTNATDAKTLLTGGFQTAINNVNTALQNISNDNKTLQNQQDSLKGIEDSLKSGLGAIVDADLAKASAKLQSLQIQQQLAVQSLQIAIRSQDYLLTLFQPLSRRY